MDNNDGKSRELSILVYSCWKNSDMWNVFIQLFRKYWKDCPYSLILLTDKLNGVESQCGFDEVVVLDSTWKEMVYAGMNIANTQYVMLWMDDYLLCDYVRNEDVEFYMNLLRQYNAANIRFAQSSFVVAKTYARNYALNYYESGTAYSFTTQIGIWNACLLKEYMRNYCTPWDFERRGSVEIRDWRHPLLAPKNYVFPYEEGVRKGKWMENGVRLCQRNNIPIDFNRRKQMSNMEMAWTYFKGGVLEINPNIVVGIQNFVYNVRKHIMR